MPSIKDSGFGSFYLNNSRYSLSSPYPTNNQPLFGRGIDGNVVLGPGSYNINTARLGSNAVASRTIDSAVALVTVISGSTLTITMQAGVLGDFQIDDYCVLVNLQGSSSFNSNVGNWEFVKINATPTLTTISLGAAPSKNYGQTDNTNLSGQQVLLMRIPEYQNLTLKNMATLTCSAWNGTWGGLLMFALRYFL